MKRSPFHVVGAVAAAGLLAALPLVAGCGSEGSAGGDLEEYVPGAEAAPAKAHVAMSPAERANADRVRIEDATKKGWSAGPKDGHRILAGLSAPVDGRRVAPGREPGRESSEAICGQFGDAHSCEPAEIIAADKAGEFAGAPEGSLWFGRTSDFELEGQHYGADPNASCDQWTYETADQKWTGRALVGGTGGRLTFDPGPTRVDYDKDCLLDTRTCVAHVPSGYGCNEKRFVACCY